MDSEVSLRYTGGSHRVSDRFLTGAIYVSGVKRRKASLVKCAQRLHCVLRIRRALEELPAANDNRWCGECAHLMNMVLSLSLASGFVLNEMIEEVVMV